MSHRIALVAVIVVAAAIGLATAPAAAAENHVSDPASIQWTVAHNSFSG